MYQVCVVYCFSHKKNANFVTQCAVEFLLSALHFKDFALHFTEESYL